MGITQEQLKAMSRDSVQYSQLLYLALAGDPSAQYYISQWNKLHNNMKAADKWQKQAEKSCGNRFAGNESLQELTGLTSAKCKLLMKETGWSEAETKSNISKLLGAGTAIAEKQVIQEALRKASVWGELSRNLSNLNAWRGGSSGFKGFVGEYMQAARATADGQVTMVINNNGVADLVYVGKNGHKYYQQMKIGYKPSSIDFSKYKGQTLIVDKGNPYLKTYQAMAKKHGIKLVEGKVTNTEATVTAKAMQMESKITGAKNAKFVPKVQEGMHNLSTAHNAGIDLGKKGAVAGAGFSMGSNLVDFVCGDVSAGTAVKNVAKDTAIAGASSYAIGAVGTTVGNAVAGTAVGSAIGTVTGAVTTAGSAVASTAVGGAVVGASTAAVGAIGAAGTAVATSTVAAVGTVGSAIGIGGAAAAGAAAVGAAAVAAAPVVAVAAVAGAGFKICKKIFSWW